MAALRVEHRAARIAREAEQFRPQNFNSYLDQVIQLFRATSMHGVPRVGPSIGCGFDLRSRQTTSHRRIDWPGSFSNGKTVLRAGYGMFYETIIGNIPGNVMLNPHSCPISSTPFRRLCRTLSLRRAFRFSP